MATKTVAVKKSSSKRAAPAPAAVEPPEVREWLVSPEAAERGIKIEIDEPEGLHDGIPVRLVGQDYSVRAPKMAMALRLGKAARAVSKTDDPSKIAEVLSQWVYAAFGKRIGKDIMARMEDPDDLLDYPHIMQLIERVIAYQSQDMETSNPPT